MLSMGCLHKRPILTLTLLAESHVTTTAIYTAETIVLTIAESIANIIVRRIDS